MLIPKRYFKMEYIQSKMRRRKHMDDGQNLMELEIVIKEYIKSNLCKYEKTYS